MQAGKSGCETAAERLEGLNSAADGGQSRGALSNAANHCPQAAKSKRNRKGEGAVLTVVLVVESFSASGWPSRTAGAAMPGQDAPNQ